MREKKMKQDDLIDFESMYTVVKRLGIRNYKASHIETCKRIWKVLVPKSGQAEKRRNENIPGRPVLINRFARDICCFGDEFLFHIFSRPVQ